VDSDDQLASDVRVARETVVDLHTLAIAQQKQIAELTRQVRDIRYGVVILLLSLGAGAIAQVILK
jgi:hypothetical protein